MALMRLGALRASLPIATTAAPVVVLLVLAMMLLPLPALALDALFTFNIGISILVLLAAMQMKSFRDFVAFPSILLLTTLLRLSLNVASTRVVLLNGHQGTSAAGHVIESFADFLIGGSYAVGVVVFVIITVINFVVITKGAGRVAEVSARFALDAMPGKQMAIDADLNTGAINEAEARKRRAEVAQEADFYGSMDGASKFVRGDALAGIVILLINLVGGVAVGTLQHDLPVAEALRVYATLAVGDGLVAQVPALIISTAAGIVVTRVSTDQDFSSQVGEQFAAGGQSLLLVGFILAVLGLIPGMPHLAFLSFAALFGGLGHVINRRRAARAAAEARAQAAPARADEVAWDDVPVVEPLCLELPYRLIPLVDAGDASDLIRRIRAIRKKFVGEVGFLIPSVHIRDNLQLPPETYRFLLYGSEVARGQVLPDRLLAINPPGAAAPIDGVAVKDPTYGMPATWIGRERRDAALAAGYTVVEPAVVIATHLDHLVALHAHELLGRQETHDLIEHFKTRFPRLVEDTVPKLVQPAQLQRVMQLLLEEGVTVRDLRTILEVCAEHFPRSARPEDVVGPLRHAMRRQIVQEVFGDDQQELRVAGVQPDFERLIEQAIGNDASAADGAIEPGLARLFLEEAAAAVDELETLGRAPVLLCGRRARLTLSRLARRVRPQAVVLAMSELPPTAQVEFQRIVCQRAAA